MGKSKKKSEAMLRALRAMDTRHITDREELNRIAKLYNVKAAVHREWAPLKLVPNKDLRKLYQDIRTVAVNNTPPRGYTVDELCLSIDRLIADGACGLKGLSYKRVHRYSGVDYSPSGITSGRVSSTLPSLNNLPRSFSQSRGRKWRS